MKSTPEEDRLAKRLAVVERDNARLREGPPADVGLRGCGDHGCLVSPAKGVGTNGGCRCPEVVLRRMVRWQAREIARLRADAQACSAIVHRPDRAEVSAKVIAVADLIDVGKFDEAEAGVNELAVILGEDHGQTLRLRGLLQAERD